MLAFSAGADGVTAALIVIVAVTIIGAMVAGGPRRLSGADTMVGIGVAGGLLAIVSAFTRIPVSYSAAALGLCALVALGVCIKRRRLPGGISFWLGMLLLSPLLAIATGMIATGWDDFWHWLPGAAYIYTHDALVRLDLPPAFSAVPAYPPTMQFGVAVASWLSGRFLENAGAVLNVAMLASFAATLADAARYPSRDGAPRWFGRFGIGAAAVAAATLLYPGLDYGVVFSSYADIGTAAAVGVLGLMGVLILDLAGEGRQAEANSLALRFGFVAAALVNLKQANPMLLALLCAGFLIIAGNERRVPFGTLLRLAPRLLLPAFVIVVVWRIYVQQNVPGGELGFRSSTQWHFHAIPAMLGSLRDEFSRSPVFLAMMWGVSLAGLLALRARPSAGRRLMFVTAIVWLGYNAFLIAVYLGALSAEEARNAADYWRYTPHVGLLAMASLFMTAAEISAPAWAARAGAAFAAACLVLVPTVFAVLAPALAPQNKAWPVYFRMIGRELADTLPSGSKVVLALRFNLNAYHMGLRYDLMRLGRDDRHLAGQGVWKDEVISQGVAAFREGRATHLMISDHYGPLDEVTAAFGLPPVRNETVLYEWTGDALRQFAAWPLPPEAQGDDPKPRSWPILWNR